MSLSSDDRNREDAPEIVERRTLKEVLYVILCLQILSSIKKIFCQFISQIVEV
jgi:hypothetical protein